MGAADLGGVYGRARGREQAPVPVAVHGAREAHSRIGGPLHLGDEVRGVGGVADHDQGQVAVCLGVGGDHAVRVVLRLEAADVEKVAPGFESQLVQDRVRDDGLGLDAIADHRRAAAVPAAVVVGDDLGVADRCARQQAGQAFGEGVHEAAGPAPFRSSLLDSVHVQGGTDAPRPEQRQEDRIRAVDDQRGAGAAGEERRVEAGEQRVDGGVAVLRAQRRQHHQFDAAVRAAPPVDVVGPAVDGDRPTAFRQAGRQRLDHRLVAAVCRGYAAAADDQNPWPLRVERQGGPPEPPCRRVLRHAEAGADQATPLEDATAVAPQPGVGGQRRGLAQQHVAEDAELPDRGHKKGAWGVGQAAMVELQQVAVLERVEVDFTRHLPPPPGQVDAAVYRAGPGFIEHLPTPFPQPEAEFRVLAIGVEVAVEDLARDRRVAQRGAQEQNGGAAAPEHPLCYRILAAVDLVGAAVLVAPTPGQAHAARVNPWRGVPVRGLVTKQSAGDGPDRLLRRGEPFEARDQAGRVVRRDPGVGVQAQHVGRWPVSLRAVAEGGLKRPVQAAGEAGVLVQRDQLNREGY